MGKYMDGYLTAVRNYRCISTKWWWGRSMIFLHTGLAATVELLYEDISPNVGDIRGLEVSEDNRRLGIGSEMLRMCEGKAYADGKLMTQLSVDKNQDWLVGWYERNGYVIYCTGEHDHTMIKFLDPKDDR